MQCMRGFFRLVPPLCNKPLAVSSQCAPSEETERTLHLHYAQQGQVRYLFYKIATHENQNKRMSRTRSTRVRLRSRAMLGLENEKKLHFAGLPKSPQDSTCLDLIK